jgi:hypothetical protein
MLSTGKFCQEISVFAFAVKSKILADFMSGSFCISHPFHGNNFNIKKG